MNGHERLLRFLLRFVGAFMLLAIAAIFLPVEWMAWCHRWLGLGEFPASPLVDYLTRSISLLYAVYGGLMILVSFDLRRYRLLLYYIAATGVVGGLVFWGIDRHAGMPAYWTASEGPPMAVVGLLLIYLIKRLPKEG